MTVRVIEGRAGYTCPTCGRTSHNPHDVENWYCGYCHVFADQLRDELVSELDMTGLERKNWPTRRDCFTAAILTLLQCRKPDAVLVHAYVRNSWPRAEAPEHVVLHAWVEMPAIGEYEDGSRGPIIVVVDFTQLHKGARILPRDYYYQSAGVAEHLPIKRFSLAQATKLALHHGNDGPWTDTTSN